MSIIKSIFKVMKNGAWNEHYFKTSSDQVVHTKTDGQASTVKEQLDWLNSALNLTKDHDWRTDLQNGSWDIRTKIKNNVLYVIVSGNNVGATVTTDTWQDISQIIDTPLRLPMKAALAVTNKGGQNAAHVCLALDPSGMLQYISSASGMYFLGYGAFPLV